MNLYIDENLEILTAICLLSENENVLKNFKQFLFSYIPAVKTELSFLKEYSIYNYIKNQTNKFNLCNLLNDKNLIPELELIKNDKRWKQWWDSWKSNINELESFYRNLLCSIVIRENNNIEIIIPLYIRDSFVKRQGFKTRIISNFGICFEENLINIGNKNNFLKDDLSKIIFNSILTFEKIKQISFFIKNEWKKINQTMSIKKTIEIDSYISNHDNEYNFNINNYLNSQRPSKIKTSQLIKYSGVLPEYFITKINQSKIILFGEQHCVSQHEIFLCANLEKFYNLNIKDVCIEIPSIYQPYIDLFLSDNETSLNKNIYMLRDFIYKIKKFNQNLSENEKIKIHCVDCNTNLLTSKEMWQKRDQIIANNIFSIARKIDSKIIGIFGSFHIQKNKVFYIFRNDNIKTLGQIVNEKYTTFTINTFALKGEEKIGELSSPIKLIFPLNSQLTKKLLDSKTSIFLFYKFQKNQTVYMDSYIYKKIRKEISPFDASLIFPYQTIPEWSKDYE